MKVRSAILKLLSKEFIDKNAIPSNIVYGNAICNRGGVALIESSPVSVEAWVGGLDGKVVEGGGSKRRVEFAISESELTWNCTGNPKNHQIFCKHCVALAIWLNKT